MEYLVCSAGTLYGPVKHQMRKLSIPFLRCVVRMISRVDANIVFGFSRLASKFCAGSSLIST
jgi:hypothetical protein